MLLLCGVGLISLSPPQGTGLGSVSGGDQRTWLAFARDYGCVAYFDLIQAFLDERHTTPAQESKGEVVRIPSCAQSNC